MQETARSAHRLLHIERDFHETLTNYLSAYPDNSDLRTNVNASPLVALPDSRLDTEKCTYEYSDAINFLCEAWKSDHLVILEINFSMDADQTVRKHRLVRSWISY
jgi:hypothetical protein